MQKVVINRRYGGFGLSKLGIAEYRKRKGSTDGEPLYACEIERDDPVLVAVVEELGEAAEQSLAKLKVVEVPDGVEWEISEYDGMEQVAEKHQTWC